MIDNQISINNYRPFLGYYEALKLETVSKYFRYSPRKRYFSSYCLITKLCRVSAIFFSESYYHEMYHLLTSLSLLDFVIFIVASNRKCSNYLAGLKCHLKTIFQCSDQYFNQTYSLEIHNILPYTAILARYLSNPRVLIKYYLSLNNPEYFSQKYQIECSENNYSSYSQTPTSNIMVALQNIVPLQLWSNHTLYYCTLCKNTYDLSRMDYFKNPMFKTIALRRFQLLNKLLLYQYWDKLRL